MTASFYAPEFFTQIRYSCFKSLTVFEKKLHFMIKKNQTILT